MEFSSPPRWQYALRLLRYAVNSACAAMRNLWTSMHRQARSIRYLHAMEWNRAAARRTEERLYRIIAERSRPYAEEARAHERQSLTSGELKLLAYTRRAAATANRNNVTRAAAYLSVYNQHPELHWALLAHIVSRNGGWSLTDLQGEWLPHIMSPAERLWSFRMLERSNALIFHDAFPQLLLYDASRREGRSLFHLLPHLGISGFMVPFWESFWVQPDSPLLTTALIINEQNVIERSVVQHEQFCEQVIVKWDFRLHGWLQMNQVVIPLGVPAVQKPTVPLVGLTLEDFSNLDERIAFGRKLYALLFYAPGIHGRALSFMRGVPHTGSRADYWPQAFTTHPSTQDHMKLPVTHWAYSPRLADAWPDEPLPPVGASDWFVDERMLKHLHPTRPPLHADMTLPHDRLWKETASLAGFIHPSRTQHS
ncbi:DUF2515 family protein [Paenibacillus popilliae]|uniref:DUF2515 domain-containing protein n=1 Tax=Paenibacillus popilliae ATCC 14706 TaxID=1212764 RepID=M9LNJ4_PAEPP|nr:DUF2515 family protein [Paenibacillus popilliae]GAC41956.1 hypothetical protein PPOP_1313 [Paenibacillus popilliae ATCC 14706]